jgi:hypothetical protein
MALWDLPPKLAEKMVDATGFYQPVQWAIHHIYIFIVHMSSMMD